MIPKYSHSIFMNKHPYQRTGLLYFKRTGVLFLAALAMCTGAQAQVAPPPPLLTHPSGTQAYNMMRPTLDSPGQRFVKFFTEGEWYISFGTNKEYFAPTDIHVSQPGLNSDFTVHNVHGHDEAGLSGFASGDLFGPQYNIRIGRFINKNWAIELSFDHTKYTSTSNQIANVSGTVSGVPVNGNQVLSDSYFRWLLHNGANHLMVNAVYREPLYGELNESLSLAFIGKVGVGIMVPHVDNTIMGKSNNVGQKTFSNAIGIHNGWWQFGGVTTGLEAGLRFVVWKPVYIEVTDKVAYASMWNLPVYGGTANHSLWMNEVIFSIGYTFDGTKSR